MSTPIPMPTPRPQRSGGRGWASFAEARNLPAGGADLRRSRRDIGFQHRNQSTGLIIHARGAEGLIREKRKKSPHHHSQGPVERKSGDDHQDGVGRESESQALVYALEQLF